MQEDYVSFEVAKLLKEKGFDEGCSFVVNTISKGMMPVSWPTTNSDIADEKTNLIAVPTLQMAMKWLRKEHNLCVDVIPYPHEDGCFYWAYKGLYLDKSKLACVVKEQKAGFESYEQACEAAIKYCLLNLI